MLPWLGFDEPTGKSGGRAPLELRLAVVDEPGTPGAGIAEAFARRVAERSDGSLRVAIRNWPSRVEPGTPASDIAAAALDGVRGNEVELGLIPSHALGEAGADTLDALDAPLAITSLADAVRVAESPLADRLQSGVDRLSLTPLGLLPEGMYRAFGFLKPLEVAADFAGATIDAEGSGSVLDAVRALGAGPLETGTSDTGVYSSFSKGPRALRAANDSFPQNAYTTGDAALLPKVDVVVSSGKTVERLDSDEREILEEAVADVRRGAAAAERAQAAAYCRAGGTIVSSPPDALRDLRAGTAPLLARLRRDPATRALLDELARLPASASAPLRPCAPTAATIGDRPSDDELFHKDAPSVWPGIAGSFRRSLPESEGGGFATLTFYGSYPGPSFQVEWEGSNRPTCRGRSDLTHRGGLLVWNPATPCSGYLAFAWRLDGPDLVVTRAAASTRPAWARLFVGTWKRVDCTPWVQWRSDRDFVEQEARRKRIEHGFCR